MLRRQSTLRVQSRLPHIGVAATVVAWLLASPVAATAQPTRFFVDVNGGSQISTTDFGDNVVFTEFVEEGDFNATHAVDSGPIIDVGGGIRLGKGLALGVGFTRFDGGHDAGVAARIPHPFFFDQHRSISGSALNLTRQERAVHLHVRWLTPVPGPVQLTLFAGPSFFSIEQDLVTAVNFAQSFPFATASFVSAETSRHSESVTGYHLGADATFFFSRHIGVGGLVRVSRASVDFISKDGGPVPVDLGGVQLSGGLRVRF